MGISEHGPLHYCCYLLQCSGTRDHEILTQGNGAKKLVSSLLCMFMCVNGGMGMGIIQLRIGLCKIILF